MDQEFQIEVLGGSSAEAGRRGAELEIALRSSAPGVVAKRAKLDDDTMDLGTIIGVVVTSAAIEAVARGIATWLAKRQGAEIKISEKTGTIDVMRITSADAVRIAELIVELRETASKRK